MNPNTLKQLGDEAASRKLSPMEVHAHADAWEADLDDYARLHEDYLQQGNEVIALRQRLAEISRLAGAVLEQCADTTAVVALRAALAGEET